MDERETTLMQNHQEYHSAAGEAYGKQQYNVATTLFFKSLVALCDLHIYRKTGSIPTSHTHRFRILEERFPEIYRMMDRDFPFYQDSYSNKMDQEAALLLKEDAQKLKETVGA
jgi:hypothetical protein